MTSAQPIYQPGELHKIRDAEERPLLAQNNLGISGREVRPLWRHGADGSLIHLEQEPPFVAVKSLAHAKELLTAEGVKRVGDPHKAR